MTSANRDASQNPNPKVAGAATATAAEIAAAAVLLRGGDVVAFPTETVYGLGADASNAAAVAQIFALKGRPATHPLIVHLASAADLPRWCRVVPAEATRLAQAFWPGPLTLILPRAPGVLDQVTGGQDTVGVRVPAHPVAQALLKAFGGGIAAPSANKFGRVSPTRAAHVRSEFAGGAGPAAILDGGDCAVGVESTILDLTGLPNRAPTLLRPGGITREQLEAVLGCPVLLPAHVATAAAAAAAVAAVRHTGAASAAPATASSSAESALPRAPGTLESHYAPLADVYPVAAANLAAKIAALQREGIRFVVMARRQDLTAAEACGAVVGECGGNIPCNTLFQALPDDDAEYARRLYQLLRAADDQNFEAIVIVPPAAAGLGAAIIDRLTRAAAE